jgi:hypothetical protein
MPCMANAYSKLVYSIILSSFVVLCPSRAKSQDFIMEVPSFTGVSGQVTGGAPVVDSTRWPATFVFRDKAGDGCTATAVGPQAILTAAHCVESGTTGSLTVEGKKIGVTCDHNPDYPRDISADFALCYPAVPITTSGMRFETLDDDTSRPRPGERVSLLGYGCQIAGGVDKSFGALFEGSAIVANIAPNGLVQTKGAALCYGDSGGGAFIWMNQDKTIRHIFATNAVGDVSQNSWLAPVAAQKFRTFANQWAAARATKICGIDSDASNCRQ